MNNNTFPNDKKIFCSRYIQGLEGLSESNSKYDGLNQFLLKCANAYFDPSIQSCLENELQKTFTMHKEQCVEALKKGTPSISDDDLLVFLKMELVGFDQLKCTEWRDLPPWRLAFNQFRFFRPKRLTEARIESIRVPFDAAAFHFNKSFLKNEEFWNGILVGKKASLFYNKFPYAPFHAVLVPDKEGKWNQFLTDEYAGWILDVGSELSQNIPGLCIGFNSIGAYASVNHLHFHISIDSKALPVTEDMWKHNGGKVEYPCSCKVFDAKKDFYNWLNWIHELNVPYNLVYTDGKIYCFARNYQGACRTSSWTSGFAWYEMSGVIIITSNHDDYMNITEEKIESEFRNVTLNLGEQEG